MFNRTRVAIAGLRFVLLGVGVLLANQAKTVGAESKEKDQVLRHAVFFKFKDGTSTEEVKGVVDAFRALPAKIEAIREFELGETLPKSERNDGLTHCFLLTFDDERGREAYLPHPSHKEFGRALGPHLEKVFVIDYWGRPQDKLPKKPLRHAVFFKFKDGTPEDAVKKIEDGLAALPAKIDAIRAFEWGKNNSPEKHDQGFTHCFMITFDSEESLKQYMEDAAHVAVVQELLPILEKVCVMDFYAEAVRPANDE